MLSGDDDGMAYVVYPLSEDPSDWTYQRSVVRFIVSPFRLKNSTKKMCAVNILHFNDLFLQL